MPLNLHQRLSAYIIGPWDPIRFALYYFSQTVWSGLSGAQDRTFASWYSNLGHHLAKMEEDTAVPRLVGLATGITLEIGPAVGNQLPRFDHRAVTHIYGIEPNEELFAVLKGNLANMDEIKGIYTPIKAALEDDATLEKYGIVPESLDTVVCMQVLCSVEDVTDAAKRIHRLLKPGGRLLFWEHGASDDSITWMVQNIWGVLWRPLLGGCRLSRNTQKAVMDAGPWRVEELEQGEFVPYSLLPRVWGNLVKLDG